MSVTPQEIESLHKKYPGYICVLVKQSKRGDLPPLDKHKYIVPKSLTVGAFLFMIRKRITLPPEKAMYLFIENTLPTSSSLLSEMYTLYGKEGYLAVTIAAENTFGSDLSN